MTLVMGLATATELQVDRFRSMVRQLLNEPGVTQTSIAKRIDIDPSMITYALSRGRRVSITTIRRLGSAYGVQDRFFDDPGLGDSPDYRQFVGRPPASSSRVERDDLHPAVLELRTLPIWQDLDDETREWVTRIAAGDGGLTTGELLGYVQTRMVHRRNPQKKTPEHELEVVVTRGKARSKK
jgi:transcriptional regulator with XRE-family HTH domain